MSMLQKKQLAIGFNYKELCHKDTFYYYSFIMGFFYSFF